ncbi:MAG: hypothetical protein MRQ07_02100 [Candidatus Midichloria sp.]|nr:hypothetical protein [Candidatus Midichloria sp.]
MLFDEYDQVINSIIFKEINAINSELVAKATKANQKLFSSCSKSNSYVEKAIFTGFSTFLKRD